MAYPVIDAHQHFWKYDPKRDVWITDDMQLLKRDFLPNHLQALLQENHISGTVVIQSDGTEKENLFQLALAEQYSFIKGIVGWVDLQAPDIEGRLLRHQQYKKLKGFREVLQHDPVRDRMLNPAFRHGISLLNKYGFSYDLLIFPDQLIYAEELTAAYPEQRFVIDHLAKPDFRSGDYADWKKDIRRFAGLQHVYCKMSGMVSEADWNHWKPDDFRSGMDSVLETFGTKRIMFGSDWPVCLLAARYDQVKQIVQDYFYSFSETEQSDFFGGNAIRFYQLT